MWKLLMVNWVPEEALDALRGRCEVTMPTQAQGAFAREAVLGMAGGFDAMFCTAGFAVDEAFLAQAGGLRVVGNMGAGYDNIDVAGCAAKGITVVNAPTGPAEATAELAVALMMAAARGVVAYDRQLRKTRDTRTPLFFDRDMLLMGKTVGILGFGHIGQAVGRRCRGLGMQVLYHKRQPLPPEAEAELGARYAGFDELVAAADVLSCHTPYTPATHHLIGREVFERMKPGAYLVNTARGPVVDEAALVEALRQGRIRGAATDVYETEPEVSRALAELDNIVLTPHIGSNVREVRVAMVREALTGVVAVLEGRQPGNVVRAM